VANADDLLKELLGPVGYVFARPLLKGVKIRFDTDKKEVRISRGDVTHIIKFDTIEQAVNE